MKKNSILVKTVLMSMLTAATFTGFTSCQDDLDLDTTPQMEETAMTRGLGGYDNVNDEDYPACNNKFTKDNWRQNAFIYLYDKQSSDDWGLLARQGYKKVALPWASEVDNSLSVQSHIPSALVDQTTPENGWEMVLNYCGYNQDANANLIFFYNKYTGMMRVMYYIPEDFSGGGDHFWEVSVTDNMAYRSPWRYGVPMDHNIDAEGKKAIGQTDTRTMHDLVMPWCSEMGTDARTPNQGWWAFDFDMSNYNTQHTITDQDEIVLTLHTQDKSAVTLQSTLTGQMSGSISLNSVGGLSGGDVANGILTGLAGVGKLVAGGIAAKAQRGMDAFNGLADALGLGAGMAGIFGGDGTSLEGTISLGMTGNIDTQGIIQTAQTAKGFPSGLHIKMAKFDMKNSHMGQGVWNLKMAPFIYMTNQLQGALANPWSNDKDAEYEAIGTDNKKRTGTPDLGCVWFFDPHSVQVELNHDIFPEEQIDYMQVDVIPGARFANKVTGTDAYRKFLGLNDRDLNKINTFGFNTGLGDDFPHVYQIFGRANQSEILSYYYRNSWNDRPEGTEYCIYAPAEKVNGKAQVVFGMGIRKQECIVEPQLACTSFILDKDITACIAPPVEVNVRVTLKMKNSDKVYVFNRIYLPQVKFKAISKDNPKDMENLWNTAFNVRDYKDYQEEHLETYDYNRKRCYDKIKFMFPNANISYEAWDQPNE